MRIYSLTAIAVGLLLAVGVYHGLATDRWHDPQADAAIGIAPERVNLTFGDWHGEILPRGQDDDPKTSVLNLRYTNRKDGKWLVTSISSGRGGRVSIHNPEQCYLGSGYELVDSIRLESLTVDGSEQLFWTGHFQKKKPTGVESIRIYWGWATQSPWVAPQYPRLYFAATARLHKLYMIHPVMATDAPADLAEYHDLMAQFVQELNRCLAQ
ncbi:MAG TPA: hypothetical protein VGZ47_04780 [Gemmataceae bacterium]|jgi:hypothetical protein|nr:hypothetical protein [Gemmataceae bacterium]